MRLLSKGYCASTTENVEEPDNWIEIGSIIKLLYPYYQGFVVLHGTDTMTYTASALSFMFSNLGKPVIFTGAERPIALPETDAELNMMRALRLAAYSNDEDTLIPEVCIFFGTRLLRANRTKKTHALDFNGFDSPNWPHLGRVEDKVRIDSPAIRRPRHKRAMGFKPSLDDRVAMFEIFPGPTCLQALRYLLLECDDVKGVILKTYGTGNAPSAPEDFLEVIRSAVRDKSKIIVNLSHCPAGEVEVRLFETNARLFELGVINCGDMTSEAAYTKLMWALDEYGPESLEAIKRDMLADLRGERRYNARDLTYRQCHVAYDRPLVGSACFR